jgi:excisionase family DNA binding protein
MQDAVQDQGVTIAEAAATLGISSDTVRRRIRRGDLRAMQVPTPNGPAWRVLLGSVPTLDGALGAAPSRPSDVEAGYLADLVRQLAERAEANAAAAAMWQARAQFLQDQVEQLQRALPAPSDPDPSPARAGAESVGFTEQPAPGRPEQNKRAWWRALRFW